MGDRDADQRGRLDRPPAKKVNRIDPLDDPECMLHGYRADLDLDHKQMRIVFYKTEEKKDIAGFMLMEANEAYEFADYVLRSYDKLEGLDKPKKEDD